MNPKDEHVSHLISFCHLTDLETNMENYVSSRRLYKKGLSLGSKQAMRDSATLTFNMHIGITIYTYMYLYIFMDIYCSYLEIIPIATGSTMDGWKAPMLEIFKTMLKPSEFLKYS